MSAFYTVTALPDMWPGKKTVHRRPARFKTQWTRTLEILQRELRHLGAKNVELALELRGPQDLNREGGLRADARPGPAVIVSFVDGQGQRQAYPCDNFAWWQDNLYAIAVVLEDLRRAERYGVQSTLLRAGFKALPATTSATMTTEWAAQLLLRYGTTIMDPAHVLGNKENAKLVYREAKARTHPDAPLGSTETFKLVEDAKVVIEQHFGSKL